MRGLGISEREYEIENEDKDIGCALMSVEESRDRK